MSNINQKIASKNFVEKWKNRNDEKQYTFQFWSDLLHQVFGITDFSNRVEFEKRVPLLHQSYIDVYIPETKVLIEQKSVGIDLLRKQKQSDGTELNAFEQARRYGDRLPYSEHPRWIVTCNFQEFLVYDMEEYRPEDKPIKILLDELPEKYNLLSFLLNNNIKRITTEQELSFKAGKLVGKLYDLMLPLYKNPNDEHSLQSLNKFCVRIVFLLFAEDALLFGSTGSEFHDYLVSFLPENRRKALISLFKILDQPYDNRDPYESKKLLDFPYVNGGLFSDDIEIPNLTDEVMRLILEDMSEGLNWSNISPTIFGSVFESTLNPKLRRKGGMHYTSIENIHKVIDPLFLNDLYDEFNKIVNNNNNLSKPKRQSLLNDFHKKLTELYFLDPACGSGNFLTETFICLRRLENKVIEEEQNGLMVLEFANPVKVNIGQFAGIEINDFAVTVARTALWIAESQMIKETEAIVNQTIEFFPLKTDAKIVEGNALRMDWNDVVDRNKLDYIMGNPPFIGYSYQSKEQKADIFSVCKDENGKPYKRVGKIDYVSAWYFKAALIMIGTHIKTAFVSTNSITQGDQVFVIWKPLFERYGIHIDFAYKTFKWVNETTDQAGVHVVIIGFSMFNNYKEKRIFSSDGKVLIVNNISPYLIDAPTLFIQSRNKPFFDVPDMINGNRPADGGNLIIEEKDYESFVNQEPKALRYIKPFVGSETFINNKKRYCLWLVGVTPDELRSMPLVLERVNKCREDRLKGAIDRQKLADTPMLFRETFNPSSAIVIPIVSSEKRKYIPMSFVRSDVIVGNTMQLIPDAEIYHFGVLTSNVHMEWMRTIGGRLEMRYSYSKNIVYNNFPWPTVDDQQRAKIEQTAQAILDARALYPNASLADLYDDLTMPMELRKAHQTNDRAVMEAYGMWGKVHSEEECVAWLFKMYEELVKKESK